MEPARLTTSEFWRVFLDAMNDLSIPDFAEFYNNAPTRYRSRNNRPRTDVMLKNSSEPKSVLRRVVDILLARGLLPADGQIGSERYIDLSYAVGNWWNGDLCNLLAVEVENNWAELFGTIRDLMQFQARLKVGVFYRDDLVRAKSEVESAFHTVANCFAKQGSAEAEDTGYLVVVAPDKFAHCTETDAFRCAGYFVDGLTRSNEGRWVEVPLWNICKQPAT